MLLGMLVMFQSSVGCFHSLCDLTRRLEDESEETEAREVIGFAKFWRNEIVKISFC